MTPTAPRAEPAKCVLADALPFSQQQGQQKATHTGRSPPQSRSREIRSGGSRARWRYSRLDVNRLQNKGGAKRLVIGRGLTKSEISDADWRRHGTTIMRGAGKSIALSDGGVPTVDDGDVGRGVASSGGIIQVSKGRSLPVTPRLCGRDHAAYAVARTKSLDEEAKQRSIKIACAGAKRLGSSAFVCQRKLLAGQAITKFSNVS